MIDLRKLIEAGVHFGHQTWRWCPKMQPYIWGEKNSIHLIDVSKTAAQLERAAAFLESVASQGRPILWIGTKKAAQAVIADIAAQLKNPFVNHRWIGGTLTNFPQVKKSVTKLLHYEDILSKAEEHTYTKKERVHLQKMADRHRKNVGGICNLTWPIGALVVVDVKKEHTAVREAASMGIPVIGIVDTNSDPSVDYPIPANDDITRAISLLTHYLAEAAARGYAVAATRSSEDIKSEDRVEAMLKKVLGEEDEERGQRGPQRRSRGSTSQQNRGGRRPAGNRARPQGPRVERPSQEADSAKPNEAEASSE